MQDIHAYGWYARLSFHCKTIDQWMISQSDDWTIWLLSEEEADEGEEKGGWGGEGKMTGDRLEEMEWEELRQNTLWTLSRCIHQGVLYDRWTCEPNI